MTTTNAGDVTTAILAASFAIQKLLQLLDFGISQVAPSSDAKQFLHSLFASAIGLFTAYILNLNILPDLTGDGHVLGIVATGLAIGGGTEGINSVLKFAQYSKDAKKPAAGVTATAIARQAHFANDAMTER